MKHTEVADTLQEIIDYFESCMGNTAPISTGRKRFRRYIEALREAKADQIAAMWEGDDGK